VNGYRREGFAAFDKNVRRGRRLSAARAYLHPVMDRPNLTVVTRAMTTSINFDRNRAIGVTFRHRRRNHTVSAERVVVAGGAFNTPQLLQLSGVGDPDHLRSVGVEPVAAVPGVGENLKDHLEVYIQHACKEPVSMQPYLAHWRKPFIGLQWLARRGPATTNHFEAGAFLRSNPGEPYPNLMFHFLPIAIRYDGTVPTSGHGYQVHVGPMYSDAMGTVKIRSSRPDAKPAIQFNYLSTEQDRREWIETIHVARSILNQPAFDPYNGGEVSPGPAVQSDQEIIDWVARDAETALHPSCTARMGVDDMAVVDPSTMAVHNTENLFAVDASVMPEITNGNIYAPTMMIAEKAADLLLENTPLPPEEIEVFRGAGG
jgi:choline dehydrogenase